MDEELPGSDFNPMHDAAARLGKPVPEQEYVRAYPETAQPSQSRLENYRREIPETMKSIAQVVVDNPGPIALIIAGDIVLARAVANIVRPRTPLESLALAVVLQVGLPALTMHAVRRGWIKLRVRDHHGCLVPLEPEYSQPGPG